MTDPNSADELGAGVDDGAGGDYEYHEAHGGGDEPTVPDGLGDELPPVKQQPDE